MTHAAEAGGLSQAAVAVLGALLEARTGQQLARNRSWRIDTALKPLLRERGLASLGDLVAQLLNGTDPQIGDRIVDALVNQESSFFRDAAVFEQIPDALAAVAPGRRPRIWSAGCATGQEPLSLAMLTAERHAETGADRAEIVATDVSEGALARARAGRFTQFEIQRGLSVRRMMRWFEGVGDDWAAAPALMRDVTFRRLNLVVDRPPTGRFDMVLCRNVLLYLAPAQRAAVFARIAEALRPGGLLLLGAGETLIGQTGPLQAGAFQPSPRFRGFYELVAAANVRAA